MDRGVEWEEGDATRLIDVLGHLLHPPASLLQLVIDAVFGI